MDNARIEIRKAVAMDSTTDHTLYCDLYLPEQTDEEQRPAIVLVFGGSWRIGERSQQKVYGIMLAKAGFVCLATDYRPSTQARWPAQLDDVKSAIRWLRTQSTELRINPKRIAVSGNSSGGHIALMVAAESSASEDLDQVRAVCAFYPPTKLIGLDEESRDNTVRTLMGEEASREDYENASPLYLASRPFPPVLLLTGGDDRRVPVEHTHDLYDALRAAGNTVDLHVFAGQGHAFDAELPFAKLSATLMTDFFGRYV
jgi:acetyl esterase/lipase